MRRRDFAIGVLLAAAARTGRAQEVTKQRRIAIVISTGPSYARSSRAGIYCAADRRSVPAPGRHTVQLTQYHTNLRHLAR